MICESAGTSWMFQNRVPHILAGDYTPLSAVNIFVKDLGIVLDSARKTRAARCPSPPPRTRCSCRRPAAGHGGEDDSAVVKIFPGIELPGRARGRSDMAPLLGCIADDFTGATDLAGMLVRAGMRTVQTIGVPPGLSAPTWTRWWSR